MRAGSTRQRSQCHGDALGASPATQGRSALSRYASCGAGVAVSALRLLLGVWQNERMLANCRRGWNASRSIRLEPSSSWPAPGSETKLVHVAFVSDGVPGKCGSGCCGAVMALFEELAGMALLLELPSSRDRTPDTRNSPPPFGAALLSNKSKTDPGTPLSAQQALHQPGSVFGAAFWPCI